MATKKELIKKIKKQEKLLTKCSIKNGKLEMSRVERRCKKYVEMMLLGWNKGWDEGMYFMLKCLHGSKKISNKTLYKYTEFLMESKFNHKTTTNKENNENKLS